MYGKGIVRTGALLLALCLCAASCGGARAGDGRRVWVVGSSALVNGAGEVIVPMDEYAEIRPVREGLFAARRVEDDGWLLLDESGQAAVDGLFEDVYGADGWIVFRQGGLYGAMDGNLDIAYEAQYTQLVSNGEGGFLALRTDPEDENGDGVYRLDGEGGEETTGTVTVYGLGEFSCGLCPATSAGKKRYGYLDAGGLWAISAQFGYALRFTSCGLAVASVDSGVGLIDTEGNWALSPRYETVALSEGNALAAAATGTGRVILYDAGERRTAADLSGGSSAYARTEGLRDMALVTIDGTVSLYGRDGRPLVSWDAEEGATVRSAGPDTLIVRADAGACLFSAQGSFIAGPFARVHCVGDDLFACETETGCALVDEGGETVLETAYRSIRRGVPGLYLAADDGDAMVLIDREGSVRAALSPDAEEEEDEAPE